MQCWWLYSHTTRCLMVWTKVLYTYCYQNLQMRSVAWWQKAAGRGSGLPETSSCMPACNVHIYSCTFGICTHDKGKQELHWKGETSEQLAFPCSLSIYSGGFNHRLLCLCFNQPPYINYICGCEIKVCMLHWIHINMNGL